MLHTLNLLSGGVGVWPTTARGWEQPVYSPVEGYVLRSPNGPGTPEIWPAVRCHPGWLPRHQGGEKVSAKILQYFPVHILQVSRLDGTVTRLIGAATAPGTQPD